MVRPSARHTLAALALVSAVTVGCYSSRPIVTSALPAGMQVQLQLTDAGRSSLGETLGPSVDVVDGRLVSRDSAGWTVAVSAVHLLRGGQQVWSGERIRIRNDFVALASEKRFSRSKTATVAAITLGVVFAVARTSLAGLLQGDEGKTPSDSGQTTRIPRP